MRAEFDKVEETYNPDIHDKEVAAMASEKFGITIDKGLNLYSDMEMRIPAFQIKRYEKEKSK